MFIQKEKYFQIIQGSTDELVEFTKNVDTAIAGGWQPVNVETVSDTTGKMFFVAYLRLAFAY